jgi:hypothetical protein
MPRGGKRQTSFDSARAREAAAKSAEARRQKRAEPEPELSDREQAKAALRRALDGNNRAAMVAAAKALIEFDRSPEREQVTVEDARAALDARLSAIWARRIDLGMCPTCNGSGRLWMRRGRGRGSRIAACGAVAT